VYAGVGTRLWPCSSRTSRSTYSTRYLTDTLRLSSDLADFRTGTNSFNGLAPQAKRSFSATIRFGSTCRLSVSQTAHSSSRGP
jgi:hypothetical protein